MDPNIIVMITLLSLPSGERSVHLKPFDTVAACVEAAEIEASDPFVARVECSELTDGSLTLSFKRGPTQPGSPQRSKTAS
jgi:hypothetical protein